MNEEGKLFKGFPDSFFLSSIPFIYLFFYLWYCSLRGTALSIYEWYSLNLIPILFIIGVRGAKETFDALGFNLNNAPIYIVIGRFLILAFIGVVFGFSAYKFINLLGMQLFPFDVFYLQLTTANPLVLSIIDTAIIAFFEEVIRIVPILGYANAFYKRGIRAGDAIIYATMLGSLGFIICHYFAWGGLNIMNVLVMAATIIFMTLIGWLLYHKQLWGPLTFQEFSIYSPMFCHFTYDLSVTLSLRVLSILPLVLGLI
jgi:hypothetical protein